MDFSFHEPIPVNESLLVYCSKGCFVDWLIDIGKLKLKKIFFPFTIEIPINSPEEYWEVWHRMNAGTSWLEGYKNHLKNHPAGEKKGLEFKNENSHKLWKYVDNYKEEA